jgi:hypothetical protein
VGQVEAIDELPEEAAEIKIRRRREAIIKVRAVLDSSDQ